TLCRFHHHQVHEGNVAIQVLVDGAFRFSRPDGRTFDSIPPVPDSDASQLPLSNEEHDIHITPTTANTLWRGERMDYGLGIEVLLQQQRRGSNVPAGAPPAPLAS